MPLSGLEATADAIQQFEGWKPGTRSYINRNPGNLRLQGQPADERGYTIFATFLAGYSALISELHSKFSGQNAHGIGQSSTLLELMQVYSPVGDGNKPDTYADFVATWLTRALGKPITVNSPLSDIWSAQNG